MASPHDMSIAGGPWAGSLKRCPPVSIPLSSGANDVLHAKSATRAPISSASANSKNSRNSAPGGIGSCRCSHHAPLDTPRVAPRADDGQRLSFSSSCPWHLGYAQSPPFSRRGRIAPRYPARGLAVESASLFLPRGAVLGSQIRASNPSFLFTRPLGPFHLVISAFSLSR